MNDELDEINDGYGADVDVNKNQKVDENLLLLSFVLHCLNQLLVVNHLFLYLNLHPSSLDVHLDLKIRMKQC